MFRACLSLDSRLRPSQNPFTGLLLQCQSARVARNVVAHPLALQELRQGEVRTASRRLIKDARGRRTAAGPPPAMPSAPHSAPPRPQGASLASCELRSKCEVLNQARRSPCSSVSVLCLWPWTLLASVCLTASKAAKRLTEGYCLGARLQRAAGCCVRAVAAPPRPDVEAMPNAARFTEQIIADEKKCALALPRHVGCGC